MDLAHWFVFGVGVLIGVNVTLLYRRVFRSNVDRIEANCKRRIKDLERRLAEKDQAIMEAIRLGKKEAE